MTETIQAIAGRVRGDLQWIAKPRDAKVVFPDLWSDVEELIRIAEEGEAAKRWLRTVEAVQSVYDRDGGVDRLYELESE